jgi:hypothetical protein
VAAGAFEGALYDFSQHDGQLGPVPGKRGLAAWLPTNPIVFGTDRRPREAGPGIAKLPLPPARPTLDMSDWADDEDCLVDET